MMHMGGGHVVRPHLVTQNPLMGMVTSQCLHLHPVTPTPLFPGENAHPTRLASRVIDLQARSRGPPLPGDFAINGIVPDRPHPGDFKQSLESC